MSNVIEYKDKIAFHPGYYVRDAVEDSGLTQEDFARRLDTTPKNLSLLIRGKQDLSIDIASKLSVMLGTSAAYWLNLQRTYDEIKADILSEQRLTEEHDVLRCLDYFWFRKQFALEDCGSDTAGMIRNLRLFFRVSSLSVLKKPDLSVRLRIADKSMSDSDIIRTNAMIQTAMNIALQTDCPPFSRRQFERLLHRLPQMTADADTFTDRAKQELLDCGIVLVILPHLPGSKVKGAVKKLRKKIVCLVTDRVRYEDELWFTLFHELGHIHYGDFGASFENGPDEQIADRYAENLLVPEDAYQDFILGKTSFSAADICLFAETVHRNPGLVVRRLRNDSLISPNNKALNALRRTRTKNRAI